MENVIDWSGGHPFIVQQLLNIFFDECQKISERLKLDGPAEHIDAIQPYSDDKDFSLLANSDGEQEVEN